MNKPITVILLTIALIPAAPPVFAQDISRQANSEIVKEFKTLISDQMQSKHLVGVGAALIIGDSVVWKEGFGYADKDKNIPFTTQTVMNIGSITKPFTAMGIMQLDEKNLLDADKPLVDYLPQFRIRTRGTDIRDITVKSVIQHTSGIPNEISQNAWAKNENYTHTVDYLKDEYQAYPVNLCYHYSNVGYCLLGHTILKVSGQEYPDYIRDHILKPIGMNNSGFRDYSTLKNVCKTYDSTGIDVDLGKFRNIPAGGLYSSVDDMVKFAQEMIAVYHGKKGGILKPETLKAFEIQNNDNIENFNNCFAWTVFRNDSSLVIMHGGSNHLANSMITIDLKRRCAIVFFVNTLGGQDLGNEAFGIFGNMSGITSADYVHPWAYKNHQNDTISADLLKRYAGSYFYSGAGNVVKFENDSMILNSVYGDFLLKAQTSEEFLPGIMYRRDSIKWLAKPRFIFNEIMGYQLLFWQDAKYKRQLLGHLEIQKEITETWKSRLGTYKLEGEELIGWDKYTEVELSIAENNFLQLKIFYTSGEYSYFMHVENNSELIFCGFGEPGGETIRFKKQGQDDLMIMRGSTFRKTR